MKQKLYALHLQSKQNKKAGRMFGIMLCVLLLHGLSGIAQTITTFAGTTIGYSGDLGPATNAQLANPYGVAVDAKGNVYVADESNYVVRKISASGVITTYAGNHTNGYSGDGGLAIAAQLSPIAGIAIDRIGNLYIADRNSQVVRKVDTFGIITTFAGNNTSGYSGDAGLATNAQIHNPNAIVADTTGNVYFTDESNSVIRMVNTSGVISTFAGTGTVGYSGDFGPATNAQLGQPEGLAIDKAGNIYISDISNSVIRKVSPAGSISTFAGNGTAGYGPDGVAATVSELNQPYGLSVDRSGNVYIADAGNHVIRKVSPSGIISTYAGNGTFGFSGDGGPATAAQFSDPLSVAVDSNGRLYVADQVNNLVRLIGNTAPTFDSTSPQPLSTCENIATDFSSLLAVTDTDAGQTETWSVFTAPLNGTITTGTTHASGTGVAPTGFIYTPATGYSGLDAFTMMVDDGNGGIALTVINVTIHPTPTVDTIGDQTVCNGTAITPVIFTGAVIGTTYTWMNSNPAIGLPASGSGSTISFTGTNVSTAPITGNIVVTPSANGCTGTTRNFNITVNPTPGVLPMGNQVVCNGDTTNTVHFSGAVIGTTYTWTNSDTTIGLAANGTGTINSFTATDSTNAPRVATINVTPTAHGCSGPHGSFTIRVNPTPVVAIVSGQALCNGSSTTPVFFTGTVGGTLYSWSNNDTTIGLASAGTDSIPSFTALDSGIVPVISVITVTPSANGCTGLPVAFTITVNPTPSVTPIENQNYCNGATTDTTRFTGPVAGTLFSWTNSTTSIGLAASGADSIMPFTAINNGSTPVIATVAVSPSANGCTGSVDSFTITVHPTPTISNNTSDSICSGSPFLYTPTSLVAGTSFSWSRADVSGITPGTNAGIGSIFETLTNSMLHPINVVYVYTLTANICTHTENFTLTVEPSPHTPLITTTSPAAVCTHTMYQNFGASTAPADTIDYSWSATNADLFVTGTSGQYALVNFTDPGTALVILHATVTGFDCPANDTFTVAVGPSVAPAITVFYFNDEFACLPANMDSYQWGYDDHQMDSTILTGEINQDYVNAAPDNANKNYWCIATKDGCSQKGYYHIPTGVQNISETNYDVRLYPNPATQIVTISYSGPVTNGITAEVYNMLGQKVMTTPLTGDKTMVDVSALVTGNYIVSCYLHGTRVSSTRLTKN